MSRTVFFISDGTGITVENIGKSLLTQFEEIPFIEVTIPYIDSLEKAEQAVQQINAAYENDQQKPLIFTTLVNEDIHKVIASSKGLLIDMFQSHITKLEEELNTQASHRIGKAHALDDSVYSRRIEAMNFALANDDGVNTHNYEMADVILCGVSRCAKTPTCLYLALQFGIYAANYPFTEEDIFHLSIPSFLKSVKHKLFGLTIDPKRLQAIRSERRPNSRYSSLEQCEKEVKEVEQFFKCENIPFISTTTRSIEEISATIINTKGLKRRLLKL